MLDQIAFGIVIALLFVSVIVLFCVVLVKLYIHKIRNYNNVIYQKDIEFQKILNTTILETQEQILNNISQDLHDDAGQQLTYVNFMIENLKLDSPELNEVLEPISMQVSNLSGSIRSLSHSLNNNMLMQQDILKAIEAETVRLRKNGRLEIIFTVAGDTKRLFGTNEKIVIYRIFQEITNNIIKHSKATEVTINLQLCPVFEMKITDNGRGFDTKADNTGTSTSLGLQNMMNRAAAINYTVGIWSQPGQGTVITLSEKK